MIHAHIQSLFKHVERTESDMHEYQKRATQFVIDNPFCALFVDLGLGKSCISLTAILRLAMRLQDLPVLVVGPRRVVAETWPTEVGLWEHTAPLSYCQIRDDVLVDTINRAGQLERKRLNAEGIDPKDEVGKLRIEAARLKASQVAVRDHFRRNRKTIYLVSRENLEMLINAWGRDFPFKTVIVDESDCLKDHKTNRFKALRKVRPLLKRLVELTATPAAETYLHLFAQIYLLDEGQRLGKSYTKYCERYFNFNKYTMKYTIREGAQDEIAAKISDICLLMKAEDYLPPMHKVFINDTIILAPDQMALYRQMEEDFIVQLADGTVVEAETAASRSQKLVQMSSGVLYETVQSLDEWGELQKSRVVHHLHDEKIEKLQQIVEDSQGETLLVAYHLKSSLERLKKAFPHAVVMDSDGRCIPDWNKGKIKMLLVSPQSAGHGLNLQHGGRRIVFFDIPWSLTLYKQTIGRLARQGQKLVVMIHHLVVQDTIDFDVIRVLQDKDANQEMLFALLRKYQRKLVKKIKQIATLRNEEQL